MIIVEYMDIITQVNNSVLKWIHLEDRQGVKKKRKTKNRERSKKYLVLAHTFVNLIK